MEDWNGFEFCQRNAFKGDINISMNTVIPKLCSVEHSGFIRNFHQFLRVNYNNYTKTQVTGYWRKFRKEEIRNLHAYTHILLG
jgi:hypothetical protein